MAWVDFVLRAHQRIETRTERWKNGEALGKFSRIQVFIAAYLNASPPHRCHQASTLFSFLLLRRPLDCIPLPPQRPGPTQHPPPNISGSSSQPTLMHLRLIIITKEVLRPHSLILPRLLDRSPLAPQCPGPNGSGNNSSNATQDVCNAAGFHVPTLRARKVIRVAAYLAGPGFGVEGTLVVKVAVAAAIAGIED